MCNFKKTTYTCLTILIVGTLYFWDVPMFPDNNSLLTHNTYMLIIGGIESKQLLYVAVLHTFDIACVPLCCAKVPKKWEKRQQLRSFNAAFICNLHPWERRQDYTARYPLPLF
jgi:hypothetical protein